MTYVKSFQNFVNGIRKLKIGFLNRVISIISVVGLLRKTTLTISDSTGESVSMEPEIV